MKCAGFDIICFDKDHPENVNIQSGTHHSKIHTTVCCTFSNNPKTRWVATCGPNLQNVSNQVWDAAAHYSGIARGLTCCILCNEICKWASNKVCIQEIILLSRNFTVTTRILGNAINLIFADAALSFEQFKLGVYMPVAQWNCFLNERCQSANDCVRLVDVLLCYIFMTWFYQNGMLIRFLMVIGRPTGTWAQSRIFD